MDLRLILIVACLSFAPLKSAGCGEILNKDALLKKQTFWDNKDWDWYKQTIPFFDCPDAEINTTYYYRWELITKHLVYGSPQTGYTFTEFIDRPFWSGAYGAISCPAGHQIYEVRWLRDARYARDHSRYWLRTPGAQPRNYSTWLADSVWAFHAVHPDKSFVLDLLPDLKKNYEGWAARQWVADTGMFWQNGHDDGMEFNINSRQTKDILRGANGFRPSFNAYMWADAQALANMAKLAGDSAMAEDFTNKAAGIKSKVQEKLWDPKRSFFFPMFMKDEQDKEGNLSKANTLTYQSGKFAGSPHGRELHGYVPWQFNMPDKGFESAWQYLMKPDYFYADFGPTTVERHDPQFLLMKSCCWWSGQSWPFATTQTLKAMANLLHNYEQDFVSREDYAKMLKIYSDSHRKNGAPYLAEALHPDTGSFEGHDGYNHSEHYFHSGFCDLIITGLLGLKAEHGNSLVVDPLAPKEWDYFAIDELPFRGHTLAIVWDKTGTKYNVGAGLQLFANGVRIAQSPTLTKLSSTLAPREVPAPSVARTNFAVNNDGDYYPLVSASFVAPKTSLSKICDGNYWYHKDPPNRWTTAGSPNASDWIEVDLGVARRADSVRLYFLDDGKGVTAPQAYTLEQWNGKTWETIPNQQRNPPAPEGHRPNTVSFPERDLQRIRAVLTHSAGSASGLTELEIWGPGVPNYSPAPPPAGNLAFNPKSGGFPKASASHSDKFGGKPEKAIDGKIIFLPTPMNRWTSYESPNETDWFEVDFGKEIKTSRVELAIYDDRGGVQPPKSYALQHWNGTGWVSVEEIQRTPTVPPAGK